MVYPRRLPEVLAGEDVAPDGYARLVGVGVDVETDGITARRYGVPLEQPPAVVRLDSDDAVPGGRLAPEDIVRYRERADIVGIPPDLHRPAMAAGQPNPRLYVAVLDGGSVGVGQERPHLLFASLAVVEGEAGGGSIGEDATPRLALDVEPGDRHPGHVALEGTAPGVAAEYQGVVGGSDPRRSAGVPVPQGIRVHDGHGLWIRP